MSDALPKGRQTETEVLDAFQPQETTLPVYAETLDISRQTVKTGAVEIRRVTENQPMPVSMELTQQQADIKVVPIGKYISEVPATRNTPELTIIPVYEEHIEVIKKIYLKEEIVISRKQTQSLFESEESVRKQTIQIIRKSEH